jgi:hypothetical protein
MASHFGRAEQGNAEGVVCEYERHGRPVKLKTRVTSREKEETWQAREIWATGVLQATAQTKEQTWQAVYLAIHLVRKERQEAAPSLSRCPSTQTWQATSSFGKKRRTCVDRV